MSGETQRRAAALMRERANGFITEDGTPPRVDIDKEGTCDGCAQHLRLVASYPDGRSEPWLCAPCAAYADHEAGWTQSVALAAADVLDEAADEADGIERMYAEHFGKRRPEWAKETAALRFARAFLREEVPS